jgi:hypothetical protein
VKIPVTKVGTAVKWFYGMNMDDDTIDIGFEAYFIGTDFGNFNQKVLIGYGRWWNRVRCIVQSEGMAAGGIECGV